MGYLSRPRGNIGPQKGLSTIFIIYTCDNFYRKREGVEKVMVDLNIITLSFKYYVI